MELDKLDQIAKMAFQSNVIIHNQIVNLKVGANQISTEGNSLEILIHGRESFTLEEWKDFLIRSIGLESTEFSERAKDISLVRMVPFVESNYNMVELGKRGTGKTNFYQSFSSNSLLLSGGKVPVKKIFMNRSNNAPGAVCNSDVVCFDEVGSLSFDKEDGINILKDYMGNGTFNIGRNSITATGSIVFIGNLHLSSEQQLNTGNLFDSLPNRVSEDTAFMDRIHAFVPGWEFPILNKRLITDHLGLESNFLAKCLNQLRVIDRISSISSRVVFGGGLSFRDIKAVNKTLNGLLQLMEPNPEAKISDELLEWALKVSLEYRLRVKEQQKKIKPEDFENSKFSYRIGEGAETFVWTPESFSENKL